MVSFDSNRQGYRADIDGLRAIAVGVVVLFHLGVPGFSGGYVGVDVFFVISGYLITGLLWKEVRVGELSLSRFYLRRVRRLAPALLVVSLATSVGAFLALGPEDLSSFASSLALQPFSLQNFYFLADGEYFRGAEAKPLLHTWSLAVEEQFYLFWPLLLLAARRLSFAARAGLFGSLLVGSFAANLLLLAITPKASFFLLPSRAWELGLGALVAGLEATGWLANAWTPARRHGLAWVGVLGIVIAVVAFSERTTFPGFAALLPATATAAFILAGTAGSAAVRQPFAHPLMVHLGALSYPLYLWHWPLLVFWWAVTATKPNWFGILGLIAAALVLAELTYRFVEQPIRTRAYLGTPRALVGVALAGALALVAVGLHLRVTEGAAYRFEGVARALTTAPFRARINRCGIVFRSLHPLAEVCPLVSQDDPRRRVLIWGNSHADMWSGMLAELARDAQASLYLNAKNCRPTPDSAFCGKKTQAAVLSFVSSQGLTDVVLASSWHGRYRVPDDVFERELAAVLDALSKQPVRIWLVVDTPSDPELDPVLAYKKRPAEPAFGSTPAPAQLARRSRERELFQRLASRLGPRVRVLDPSEQLCDERSCVGGRGDVAWYRDSEHLTDAGARVAAGQFAAVFQAD